MTTKENTSSDTTSSQSTLKGISKFLKRDKASKSTCTDCAKNYAEVDPFDPPLGKSFIYELKHLSATVAVISGLFLAVCGVAALSISCQLESCWTYGVPSEVIGSYRQGVIIAMTAYFSCLAVLIKTGLARGFNEYEGAWVRGRMDANDEKHEEREKVLKYPLYEHVTHAQKNEYPNTSRPQIMKWLLRSRITSIEFLTFGSSCCSFRETQLLEELETLKSKLETISKSGSITDPTFFVT